MIVPASEKTLAISSSETSLGMNLMKTLELKVLARFWEI